MAWFYNSCIIVCFVCYGSIVVHYIAFGMFVICMYLIRVSYIFNYFILNLQIVQLNNPNKTIIA